VNGNSVLVVDDEPDIRNLLQEILEDEGYVVSTAGNAAAAQDCIAEARPDLVLLDIWMPDTDGVTLLKTWQGTGELVFPVIMISGHGTVGTAVEATRHGAVDFIEKPVSLAKLLLTVEKALAEGQTANNEATGKSAVRRLPLLTGDSQHMKSIRKALSEHSTRVDSLLLTGEPGSGRLLFAQNAHDANSSIQGAFIQLRCDTLSVSHSVRELVGEEENDTVRMGYLESANGGTLFLTDVDQLPVGAQECLRTAIEQQGFTRVGGTQRVPFRCRIMASTRIDIQLAVKDGRMDANLARLVSNDTLHIKPLREHIEDTPALLEAFVNWHVEEEGLPYRHFTVAAQNRLRNLDWPGNLLEFKNLVQRILLIGGSTEVEVTEVNRILGVVTENASSFALRHDLPLREARADFERQYLLTCLNEVQGNIGDLAKHVGMERTHLYRKLRNLNIDLDKVRE